MKHNSLKDINVLITGGTSGLGLATAKAALEYGARVGIVARRRPEKPFADAFETRAFFIEGDVADKHAIHPIALEAQAKLGPIHVLVNNASTLGPVPLRPLLDIECEEFEKVLQTNLLGPFRLAKVLLPAMVLGGRGTIVNISSDAAVEGYANWGAYGSSKAALDQLTKIWSAELEGTGVRVFAADPGEMDTPMHQAALPEADPKTLQRPGDVAERLVGLIARALERTLLKTRMAV
ncbi:MAG: SDR family oxidoreductase [Bdellovibrionia bacterium]